jgi:hypothetical protein
MIVGLDRCRCRRIEFVRVAASRIVDQGGNDCQQPDQDDADDDDTRDQELDDVHNQSCRANLCKASTPTLCLPNVDVHRSSTRHHGVVRMAR